MNDLDKTLMQLRALPVPLRLATLEADVMAGIDAERRAAVITTGPALGLAAIAALALGMAGAVVPTGPVQATPAPTFGIGADMAPSTLLASVG